MRLGCDGVVLRFPSLTEAELLARAVAAPAAVLPPDAEHHVTWLADRSPEEIERAWAERLRLQAEGVVAGSGWRLDLGVFVEDVPVGVQSLTALGPWPTDRGVGTASWLLASSQGRGIGQRARAAVLELAFMHLDASEAKSWVLADNRASAAVSERLGYRVADRHRVHERGRSFDELVFALQRTAWATSDVRRHWRPSCSGTARLVATLGARGGGPGSDGLAWGCA